MSVNIGVNTKHISVFSDWFLPSKDELNQMYINLYLYSVGNFSTNPLDYYWNSSEIDATNGEIQWFDDGAGGYWTVEKLNTDAKVRPCRSFTATVGAYALRDTGPAGGLICYVDGAGTTYYEAAPSDIDDYSKWSNIALLIGTTGTAIGTGQVNTTAIISQAGHTNSAAKLCDDLEV